VQTDGKDKFVNIGIVSAAHGTHVAGITAGNDFFGGAFDGVAPGAKIVSLRACMFVSGCTTHALVEGMIYVAKQSNVDVINMSIGGLPALNDGNNARAVPYDRLIEQSNVQMFISAGNDGPGLNTIGDPAVATRVMAVGASVTKASWLANYGAEAAKDEGLFVFSSRGPREDGGFKPDVVAPGSAISGVPTWQPGQPVAGTYALPPGYGMLNGTSMAAPEATGAGALLVSAAKQAGVQKQPAQLRQAMKTSTDWLDGY
jgi:subtilisin family serine protease